LLTDVHPMNEVCNIDYQFDFSFVYDSCSMVQQRYSSVVAIKYRALAEYHHGRGTDSH
jgi:hypothetical protein